jgi:hypothetical protein
MTADEIQCIEEGGTQPTIVLLRRLAAALNAGARLNAGHNPGSERLEPDAARVRPPLHLHASTQTRN